MRGVFKKPIMSVVKKLGYELRPLRPDPFTSLLGLKFLPIKTIIDVGANEGQFAKFIQNYFPGAHLLCFEPVMEPFHILQRWAKEQNDTVEVFNFALGDKSQSLPMLKHETHTPSSSFLTITPQCSTIYPQTTKQTSIEIQCKLLDDLNLSLKKETLIKLDVQGFEDRVIRGGLVTFSRAKAAIIEVSLVPLYYTQPSFAQIVELMESLEFRFVGCLDQDYQSNGILLAIDAVFVKGDLTTS